MAKTQAEQVIEWSAYAGRANGQYGQQRIITVLADSEEGAKSEVQVELSKPGRTHYFEQWRADGCIVRPTPRFWVIGGWGRGPEQEPGQMTPTCWRDYPTAVKEAGEALELISGLRNTWVCVTPGNQRGAWFDYGVLLRLKGGDVE